MGQNNFTREEILDKCEKAIEEPAFFYKESFIISEDGLKDNHEAYRTETIAEFILDNLNKFESGINQIDREKYKMSTHDGVETDSNQEEKNLAKKLFNQSQNDNEEFSYIGMIGDYEVPLKKSNQDKGVGRIDLLSINKKENKVFILELKKKDSKESMLRCVMEIYTYSKIVNKVNLFESFKEIKEDYELKIAPLVYKGGTQWKQMQEVKEGKRPYLKTLMEKLDIKPFYFDEIDGRIVVLEE